AMASVRHFHPTDGPQTNIVSNRPDVDVPRRRQRKNRLHEQKNRLHEQGHAYIGEPLQAPGLQAPKPKKYIVFPFSLCAKIHLMQHYCKTKKTKGRDVITESA